MDDSRRPVPTARAVRTVPPPVASEPVAPASRAQRLRGPLVTAAVVGGLSLALHLRDPHKGGSWGVCPWLAMTGHYCPGCGALRAVNDLTRGDVGAALSSNLLLVLAVPLVVALWVGWLRREWYAAPDARPAQTLTAARPRTRTVLLVVALALVVVVFTVLRNLPAGAWLAP